MQHVTKGSWMGRLYLKCHGCGSVAYPRGPADEQRFLSFHQACGQRMAEPVAPGYGGLGDAVAAGTKALGVTPCAPCQRRQAMLNRAMPRMFRR
jgi:hypothetical protein